MKPILSAIACASVFMLATMFSSCDPVEPEIENEEELITTVTVTFTPLVGNAVVFKSMDLDGEGGLDAILTTGPLATNSYYEVEVELLNESVNPSINMTEEIAAESESHQIFLVLSGGVEWIFNYLDVDGGGLPLGIQSQVTTLEPGSGTLTLTLRHNPIKSALNVASGDITHADGATDVFVAFDLVIQ